MMVPMRCAGNHLEAVFTRALHPVDWASRFKLQTMMNIDMPLKPNTMVAMTDATIP